jgi:hypothetical protein
LRLSFIRFTVADAVPQDVQLPWFTWIRTTPICVMLDGHTLENNDNLVLPKHIQSVLQDLINMINEFCHDPSDHSLCVQALSELGTIFKDVYFLLPHTSDMETGLILKWATLIPSEFVSLLRRRHPAALILLAYFVVMFRLLDSRWYLNRWSDRALVAVKAAIVSSEVARWLVWPEEQLKTGLPAFTSQNSVP